MTVSNSINLNGGRGAVVVSISASARASLWSEYLARHPQATLFHDPCWGEVMASAYGNRPSYLTASRDGRTVGILQLVCQRSLLFGVHVCGLPYADAAGILADDEAAAGSLIDEARRLMQQVGAKWVELRQTAVLDPSLPVRTDKVTLRLPLPADPKTLWDDLDPKVRNQVRKAQREGLSTHHGGVELLELFHTVYVRNMRDLGSPPHSRRFFALILEHFPSAVRLFVVKAGDRPVAASFTLADRHAFRVPWAASDWRVRSSCANMLLYWSMLEETCRRQAPCFDFGRSTRNAGTYRFKTQWGAAEVPLYWYYLLPPGGAAPDLRPDSPKYRLATALWRRLPVSLVKILGPCVISKVS